MTSTEKRNKKSKITRACDGCRKKKIKCNADITYPNKCSNCKNMECIYTNKGFHSPSYVSDLETKLADSEGVIEEYRRLLDKYAPPEVLAAETDTAKRKRNFSIPSPSAQMHMHIHTEASDMNDGIYVDETTESCRKEGCLLKTLGDGKTVHNHPGKQKRFFGKGSIRGIIERLSTYTGFSPTGLLSGKRPHFWQEDLLIDGLDYLPVHMLSPDLVESLVGLYFEKVNSTLPLLDRTRFFAEIAYRRHDRNFETLLMTVLAIGSQYSNDPRVMIEGQHQFLAGFRYYSVAKSKMIDPYMDVATIEDIQALILLQIYVPKSIHSRSGWMIHGTTVLLAHDIGLHSRFVDTDLPPQDQELRKRAYWSLYLLDRVQASTFGRQPLIKDNEISLDLPDNELGDGESECCVLYFNMLIKLYNIHGQILQTIVSIVLTLLSGNELTTQQYKLRKTSDGDELLMSLTDIASLNSKLNKWLNEIPQMLKDGKNEVPKKLAHGSNGKDEYVYQLYSNLQLAFHIIQIGLYKTFLPNPRSQSTSSFRYTSLVICATSARSIISIYRDMLLERKMQHLWVDATVAWGSFSATLILIISACEGLRNNDLDPSVFGFIQSGIQILRVREEREVLNGRAVDMIMQILKTSNLPMDPSFMQAQENISYGASADNFFTDLPFLVDTPPNHAESNEQMFTDLLGQVQYNTVDAAALGVGGTPPLDSFLQINTQDWSNVLETFLSGAGGIQAASTRTTTFLSWTSFDDIWIRLRFTISESLIFWRLDLLALAGMKGRVSSAGFVLSSLQRSLHTADDELDMVTENAERWFVVDLYVTVGILLITAVTVTLFIRLRPKLTVQQTAPDFQVRYSDSQAEDEKVDDAICERHEVEIELLHGNNQEALQFLFGGSSLALPTGPIEEISWVGHTRALVGNVSDVRHLCADLIGAFKGL
ncbi:hypothetical protein E3P81_04047 [Wallemia ichthyophaga]|nr:hypothetical protein E3P97_04056 [Wallemia ichthyophaga]TIA94804.1 hypothetical protein E3P95_04051 [Wallemia ichthyophaga]TIB27640.1 hypothetical protein E3P85_04145 [Wallemia ichthyophaga]TIB45403.1 hypothetical protein E3P81_04047 [Wallemia ichthyophaga]TIB54940.1 hypothetical protein E3P79_04049 [Wallemia ichthyophaga]